MRQKFNQKMSMKLEEKAQEEGREEAQRGDEAENPQGEVDKIWGHVKGIVSEASDAIPKMGKKQKRFWISQETIELMEQKDRATKGSIQSARVSYRRSEERQEVY